ncbi:hypothetical protein [Azohydromonas aeria]|uniref:hypothetical protein n=1 Tax=Azohydromonas aeria TaxID=2590212 RepID=UPI0012FC1FFC|nr:hypothetical protein [Azohydromonas aeria]
MLAARAGGRLAQRRGRLAAVGKVVIGILLGPALPGALATALFGLVFCCAASQPMLLLSLVGLLLMLQIGLGFDLAYPNE